jgi:transposase
MSTSLLYHAVGIRGYHEVSQSFQEGQVTFRIEQPRERLRCPQCGSADVWDQGGVERTFRSLPIGGKPTFIQLKVPRVLCFAGGTVRQVKIPFAEAKKRYTHAFER